MNRPPTDADPLRGVLATLAPAAALPLGRLANVPWAAEPELAGLALAGHLGAATLLFGAAAVLPRRPTTGRALATAGVLLVTGLGLATIPRSPALGFLVMLLSTGLLAMVWPDAAPVARTPLLHDVAPRARAAARAAAWAALAPWLLAVPGEWAASPVSSASAALTLLVAELLALRWAWIARRLGARRTGYVGIGALSAVGGGAMLPFAPIAGLAVMGAAPVFTLVATRCPPAPTPAGRQRTGTPLEAVLSHPARALVATFLLLCLGGASLLSLPASGTRAISFVDALFTAVSATCVTGLSVLDVPKDLTRVGHVILLLLIQVGGLGILTFSTAAFALLGRRMSVRHEGAVADMLGADAPGGVFRTVRDVLAVTFAAEGLGAVLLTALFAHGGLPLGEAAWRGVFTAVSAFCNAGFALQSDNLVGYQDAPGVLYVVAALITVGGFSPALTLALPGLVRRRRLPLGHRLALTVSAALVVGPAVLLGAFEWSGAFAGLAGPDRVHNAIFSAVTLRTAGFNTVDMEAFGPASRTLMIACMLVGGSPGSTAGGIKTTTVALLGLAVLAAIRGREQATAFGRRISHASVYKAAAVATVGVGAAGTVFLVLQLTQPLPFDVLLFETVSALGTVGLSLNATPKLDALGRLVVAAAMFMGRVGPLTLFLLLSERERRGDPILPEDAVAVG